MDLEHDLDTLLLVSSCFNSAMDKAHKGKGYTFGYIIIEKEHIVASSIDQIGVTLLLSLSYL